MPFALRRFTALFVVAVWATAVVAGSGALWNYASLAGSAGQPLDRWPGSRVVRPVVGKVNLVMAVHPRCPCSRASIAELARLMACAEGKVEAHLLFFAPESLGAGWERSNLWQTAASIPGARSITDPEGAEAARFGLETSGHVVLYDTRGNLVFSGGITDSRGHEGDNAGLDSVLAAAAGRTPRVATHPVFGCRILDGSTVRTQEESR